MDQLCRSDNFRWSTMCGYAPVGNWSSRLAGKTARVLKINWDNASHGGSETPKIEHNSIMRI
jgi:hypothetical protein